MLRVLAIVVYSLIASASLGALSACSLTEGCTEMGCSDGVGVWMALDDGQPEATYEVDVAIEGTAVACSLLVATDELDIGVTSMGQCDRSGFRLSASRPGPGGACQEHDCQSWPEGKPVLAVALDGAPSAIELAIRKDGTSIVEKTLRPSYATEQPNGPDCEPTCRIATIKVE